MTYDHEFDSHCVDWRMHLWMKKYPALPSIVPSQEMIEHEHAWVNYQNALYHKWIQR